MDVCAHCMHRYRQAGWTTKNIFSSRLMKMDEMEATANKLTSTTICFFGRSHLGLAFVGVFSAIKAWGTSERLVAVQSNFCYQSMGNKDKY